MTTALVLGEPGTGLTTFVGLLYTAQVRYGIEIADEFRFHADRESIQALGQIYGAIGDGRFPDMEPGLDERPLEFALGFRRGRLPWSDRRGPAKDPAFDVVHLRVGGMLADEVVGIYRHGAHLSRPSQELLASPVVISLIDGARLPRNGESAAERLAQFDTTLANTLELIDRSVGAERRRRARRLVPIFVATKVDLLSEERLRALGIGGGLQDRWDAAQRGGFGRSVLTRYLPKTHAFLEEAARHRSVIPSPTWYLSYTETERDPSGEPRIRRRSRFPEGGWEPVYPYGEYRDLLTHLGELAHRLPDPARAG